MDMFVKLWPTAVAIIGVLLIVDTWLGRLNKGLRLVMRAWRLLVGVWGWFIAVMGIRASLDTVDQRLITLEKVLHARSGQAEAVAQPYMRPHFRIYWQIDPVRKEVTDTPFCGCCQPASILRHISTGDSWHCDKGHVYYELRDLHDNKLDLHKAHSQVSVIYF